LIRVLYVKAVASLTHASDWLERTRHGTFEVQSIGSTVVLSLGDHISRPRWGPPAICPIIVLAAHRPTPGGAHSLFRDPARSPPWKRQLD